MTAWKKRIGRQLMFALLFGVVANTFYYFALEFTSRFHSIAVKALGPALDIVWHHLDLKCYARSYCDFEVFGVNILLYAVCSFPVLMSIDLLRRRLQSDANSSGT